MDNRDHFMAIDLSTTACKVLIFNFSGDVVAETYRQVPLFQPRPGWIEADANDWWRITAESIHDALARLKPSYRIACIGMCGLMHAMTPVDRSGMALDRVMLWMDQRCKPQSEWLEENIFAGRRGTTYVSAPKLRWIVENRPEIVDKTYKFLFGKDYIRLKLTGEYATDESDAGGSALFDGREKQWMFDVIRKIGISEDKMPNIRQSDEIAGYIRKVASEETGLKEGTPVVIGASDVRGTCMGVNAYTPGRTCVYMGTAAWATTCHQQGSLDWLGATTTWGASLSWCRDLFDGSMSYNSMIEQAKKVPPGSDGLIFFPHLMGKRWQRSVPDARGVLFGLTLMHHKEHVIRAVLEGNAYLLRHIIDSYGSDCIGDIVATGGGARSTLWLQIIASVIKKGVFLPKVIEATALGAAMLAAKGIGVFRTLEEAMEQWVEIRHCCAPEDEAIEEYDQLYKLYRKLDRELDKLYSCNS